MAAERTVEAPRVERVAGTVWSVPSRSGGEAHVVSVHAGRLGGQVWVCDCAGYQYRGGCAHIALVRSVSSAPVQRRPRREVALT